jgi:hypothetical protein
MCPDIASLSKLKGPPALPCTTEFSKRAEHSLSLALLAPLSVQAIAKLPRFRWDETAQRQGEHSTCAICTEVLQLGDEVQQLPCHKSHLFHPPCLEPWLSRSNACPVCREVGGVGGAVILKVDQGTDTYIHIYL